MTALTVSQARAALPALLTRVAAGEEVTITRHGEPVAVVVRPDALRTRRSTEALAAADRLDRMLLAARSDPLPSDGPSPKRAEELVAAMRVDRDAF